MNWEKHTNGILLSGRYSIVYFQEQGNYDVRFDGRLIGQAAPLSAAKEIAEQHNRENKLTSP